MRAHRVPHPERWSLRSDGIAWRTRRSWAESRGSFQSCKRTQCQRRRRCSPAASQERLLFAPSAEKSPVILLCSEAVVERRRAASSEHHVGRIHLERCEEVVSIKYRACVAPQVRKQSRG